MKNKYYYYKLVGQKIQEIREETYLLERDVCEYCGIAISEYMNYEDGGYIPVKVMETITDFFGYPLRKILPSMQECNIFWTFEDGSSVHGDNRYSRLDDGSIYKHQMSDLAGYKRGNPRKSWRKKGESKWKNLC